MFLDVRLKKFNEEKQQLENEVQQLQQKLLETKKPGWRSNSVNGPVGDEDYEDAQRKFAIYLFLVIYVI